MEKLVPQKTTATATLNKRSKHSEIPLYVHLRIIVVSRFYFPLH